ncbi:acyltransferase family protein [Glaciibacter superstes]|uniref:acyltransferase family protein n=1 Tax=Glaciibacter superstes TaxID=501023 RepID=UPI0003B61F60|nr:acyltransferase family protein [Glaciibacter superstes]
MTSSIAISSAPATSLPAAASSVTHRLAGLDGLRAIAVIAVVVYHFFPSALPGGFIGVDVFFVISGFLITGLLVAEHQRFGHLSLARFWQRRVRRLVPPLIPLVLICCTVAWLIGGDILVGIGWQLAGASTFSYNWVSIASDASYFSSGQPELFRNLWSLAVEEQFYLLWPLALLAVLLIRKPRLRLVVVCVAALASAASMAMLYQPGADPTRVYYGSDTHSFGLLIGAALAMLLRRPSSQRNELPRIRPWLGLVALLGVVGAAIWLPDDGTVTYRGGLVVVCLLTAVVIWAGVRGGRFGRALDWRPLRYIGERSYGIYLWHWPVIVLLLAAWPTPDAASVAWPPLIAIAVTLLAAACSYRWLEQPIRRLGLRGTLRIVTRLSDGSRLRTQFIVATAVAALFLTAGTTAAIASAPSMSSAQAAIERGQRAADAAARAAEKAAEEAARQAARRQAPAPAGAIPTGDKITAVGDSVMLAAAPELQASFPGIAIDAAVSRSMQTAPAILTSLADTGQLRPVVLVGLGTNGPIDEADLAAIESILGPDRELVVINTFADRDWIAGVNQALAEFSAEHRLVELADWSTAIAPHTDVLAEDNIHPGPTGGRIYADCVAAALERLTDLPPPKQPTEIRKRPPRD